MIGGYVASLRGVHTHCPLYLTCGYDTKCENIEKNVSFERKNRQSGPKRFSQFWDKKFLFFFVFPQITIHLLCSDLIHSLSPNTQNKLFMGIC
jgi:hypothetical protein